MGHTVVYTKLHKCLKSTICFTRITQLLKNFKQRMMQTAVRFLNVAIVLLVFVSIIPIIRDTVSHLVSSEFYRRILGLFRRWLFYLGIWRPFNCEAINYSFYLSYTKLRHDYFHEIEAIENFTRSQGGYFTLNK